MSTNVFKKPLPRSLDPIHNEDLGWIADLLNCEEWSGGTCESIAHHLRELGFKIEEP